MARREPRLTGRNTNPSTPAGAVQASIATLTQTGIGIVRTRQCLPWRSTMHQRPSRCCMCPIVSAATYDLHRAQPRSTAMMARSRKPLQRCDIRRVQERPGLLERQPVPRAAHRWTSRSSRAGLPAANSGASRPLSIASTANLRTADMCTIIEDDASPRALRNLSIPAYPDDPSHIALRDRR